jgi:hypothetical protein
MSAGVKVTLSLGVPPLGTIVGVVQVKVPLTDAEPPLSVDDDSVWPYVIALTVGHTDTAGVAIFTVTLAEPATVL